MASIHFDDIEQAAPEMEPLRTEISELRQQLESATEVSTVIEVMRRWDTLRREHDCWASLTHLRFHQDTTNPEYKKAREHCDQLSPQLKELDISIKRRESQRRSLRSSRASSMLSEVCTCLSQIITAKGSCWRYARSNILSACAGREAQE